MLLSNEQTKLLSALAEQMVQNHLQLSIPPDLWTPAEKRILKNPVPLQQRAVIVVTGAGVSADAAGLPLGRETGKLLRERLQIPQGFLDAELNRLAVQYGLEAEEFETQLLAFSKFSGRQLVHELEKIFLRRYYASITYEILAHLLKHRFIDAIINFNFDELLDQALDDEVRRENYHRIVSDGDLPDDINKLQGEDSRFRLPLYIKPHGTASHKSSLRFTREAYFQLPENIHQLLTRLLSNVPTTLVSIGFNMQSVEFIRIMKEAAEKRKNELQVFAFSLKNDDILKRIPEGIVHNHVVIESGQLGDMMNIIWDEIVKCFEIHAKPRGIERHTLISALFADQVNYLEEASKRQPSTKSYLRDRSIVEIALAIAKARGFVNIRQLAMSRAGRYFQNYREYEKTEVETLYSLCEKLQLSRVGYAHDAMALYAAEEQSKSIPEQLIVHKEAWRTQKKNELVEATLSQLSPARQIFARQRRSLLEDTLEAMYVGEEVEVFSPKESPFQTAFQDVKQLLSLAATKAFTQQVLDKDWDTLLCVAETGRWLLEEDIKQMILARQSKRHAKLRLKLIVADNIHRGELRKTYKQNGVRTAIAQLPWWLHNQHMTLVVANGKLISGVYFERRLRALSITPVGLTQLSDLEIAFKTFCAYSRLAEHYHLHPEIMDLTEAEMDQERRDLLHLQHLPRGSTRKIVKRTQR